MTFFLVEHKKFPLSYIQDAKNFSVVKPLNSGEAVASLASPVPPPLILSFNKFQFCEKREKITPKYFLLVSQVVR